MEIRPILSALLRSKTGAILIAAQVAITLAIVCNALFVIRARLATADRPSGVDEDAVFQLQYIGGGENEDREALARRDLDALRAIPGVVSVADTNQFPLSTSGWGLGLTTDKSDVTKTVGASAYFSGSSLVDTFGLELVEGRDFEPSEVRVIDADEGDPRAESVILSKHLAGKLFPDGGPVVGKTLYMGNESSTEPMQVVGVVETLMSTQAEGADTAFDAFIIPVRYLNISAHYAVRTDPAQRARIMADAEKALGDLRQDRVLIHNRGMDEIREQRYRHEQAGAGMLVAVTIGLLLVTASGIVGIASLWVNQRRKQIGVRRALGARRVDIVRYFLTENLMITSLGVALGIGLTFVVNQLLVSNMELERLPLPYLLAGMLTLWVLGVVAALGPAWRAASVPPAVATRSA